MNTWLPTIWQKTSRKKPRRRAARPAAAGRRPAVEALEDRMLLAGGVLAKPPVLASGGASLSLSSSYGPGLPARILIDSGDMLKARIDQLLSGTRIIQPIPLPDPAPGGLMPA
jgi:hypothetical protein